MLSVPKPYSPMTLFKSVSVVSCTKAVEDVALDDDESPQGKGNRKQEL